jgi:hypothetical protein
MKSRRHAFTAESLRQQAAHELRRVLRIAPQDQAAAALRRLIDCAPWRWRRGTRAALWLRLARCEAARALRMQDPVVRALASQAFDQSAAQYAMAGQPVAAWRARCVHTLAWLDWSYNAALASHWRRLEPPPCPPPAGLAVHPTASLLGFAVACRLRLPLAGTQPARATALHRQARQTQGLVQATPSLRHGPLHHAWQRAHALYLAWRAGHRPSSGGFGLARQALRQWRLPHHAPHTDWQQAVTQTLLLYRRCRRDEHALRMAQVALAQVAQHPGLTPAAVWDLLATGIDIALQAGAAGHAQVVAWTNHWMERAPRGSRTSAVLALQQAHSAAQLALLGQPQQWAQVKWAAEAALLGRLTDNRYLEAHAHRWRAVALWALTKQGQRAVSLKSLRRSAQCAMAVFADMDDAGHWAELSVLLLLAEAHVQAQRGAAGQPVAALLPLVDTMQRRLREPSACLPPTLLPQAQPASP